MNGMMIKLPEEFKLMKQETQKDELFPDHANIYAYRTANTEAFAIAGRIEQQNAKLFDDVEAFKNGLISLLKENEGFIKVDSGITANGERYSYYIKKHVVAEGSLKNRTLYVSNMNIEIDDTIWLVEFCFYETGEIGFREHFVKKVFNTWYEDPRELMFGKGIPMDISEQEYYDDIFPEHPLSEIRKLLKYVVANN